MSHFGGNRAPDRSVAAAQGFNASLGQGLSPLGPSPHVGLGPGDLTAATGLYENSYGVGQQPAAIPPSPIGYGATYSPSDPCEPYRQLPLFTCCQTHSGRVCATNAAVGSAVGLTEKTLP